VGVGTGARLSASSPTRSGAAGPPPDPFLEQDGPMLIGTAHVAVCVPDVDEAVAWYESVLGLTILSPPYLMEGDAISDDMGELLPTQPVAVKAAMVGVEGTDHVIEVIGYPNEAVEGDGRHEITRVGISHIGLLCDDIDATRAELEAKGVEMLTTGIASIARLRTTWFRDPWGVVFILLEKRHPDRPYWRQY
jgi:catechol 2,3-dioxygenase-like lactoylglutathione lyase family enzyme